MSPVHIPPGGVVSVGDWTPVGDATLELCVDEGVDSADGDTTYITNSTLNGTCTLSLVSSANPNDTTNHKLRISAQATFAVIVAPEDLLVELILSAVVLASATFSLANGYAVFEYLLSEAEALTITDYDALEIRLTSTAIEATGEHRVSAAELRTPDRILRAHVVS